MSRRQGREARRGVSHPILVGVTGFGASNHYKTANPGGIAGVVGGFWVAVLLNRTGNAASSGRPAARINANDGWFFGTTSGTKSINFITGTGAARITSPTATMTEGVQLVVGVFDGSAVRIWNNNAQAGAGTATALYSPLSQYTIMGTSFEGAPYDDVVYGISGGHAVPTASEISALYYSVKQGSDIQPIPGKTDHLWSVKRDVIGQPSASLADKAGSDAMAIAGTLSVRSKYASYAW
jgi:hypothetical protein